MKSRSCIRNEKMYFRHFPWILLILTSIFLRDNCCDGAMTMAQMETAAAGFRKVCIPKTGADPAAVAGIKNGLFPEDENLQCYMKCVMGILKTMKNGRPLLEPIVKQMTLMMPADMQERSIAAATHCTTLDFNANECIAAWQFVKCQYETAPEVFFFP